MRLNTLFGEILAFVRREKLYMLLVAFIVLANLSLSSLGSIIETSGPSKIFDKSVPEYKADVFDQKVVEAVISNHTLYFIFQLLLLMLVFFVIFGLAIDALFLYERTPEKNPIIRTRSVDAVRWGFWDICKVIIIFFFAETVVSYGAIYASLTLPDLPLDRNLQLMFIATIMDAIAICAIFYFVLQNKRHSLSALGLTLKNMFLNIRYGISAYVGLIPVFLGVTLLTSILFKVLNIPVEPQEMVEILKKEKSLPSIMYMCVFVSFLGPIMEEIFFRGFIYGALKTKIGIFGGILTSAVFFAYVHANLASFMPILCLGLLLAYIYEKTGSLVSSITAHMIHNSIMLVLLLFLKSVGG